MLLTWMDGRHSTMVCFPKSPKISVFADEILAIAEGNGDIALELLKAGADPTKQSREGELAIKLAPDEKVRM